jgi:hypothetical protein
MMQVPSWHIPMDCHSLDQWGIQCGLAMPYMLREIMKSAELTEKGFYGGVPAPTGHEHTLTQWGEPDSIPLGTVLYPLAQPQQEWLRCVIQAPSGKLVDTVCITGDWGVFDGKEWIVNEEETARSSPRPFVTLEIAPPEAKMIGWYKCVTGSDGYQGCKRHWICPKGWHVEPAEGDNAFCVAPTK